MRRTWRILWCLLALLTAPAARGQGRDLYWKSLDVEARLDGAGTLHVRERHTMVFTGDWNGGERTFNIRLGQRLRLQGMARVDSSGREHPMVEGDLDAVDHFDWAKRNVLRWRARLPNDPPFDRTARTYLIDYTLDHILRPEGERYVLGHDFAFPERDGPIEAFTLALTLDPVWGAPPDLDTAVGPLRLESGSGYVVTGRLVFRAAGAPAGVPLGATAVERYALGSALVLALLFIGAAFVRREQATGRFAPLVPPEAIDEAWLQAHVLGVLPEVVGAAWDDSTGAPEVAAVLARMIGEKKLSSRVETRKGFLSKTDVLHLTLLVPRGNLTGYESTLIESMFRAGETETSTEDIRDRYKKSGFDPASKIREPVEQLVKRMSPSGSERERPSRWPTAVMFLVAVGLVVGPSMRDSADVIVAAVGAAIMLVLYVIAAVQAMFWRQRVHEFGAATAWLLGPMVVMTLGVLWLHYAGASRLTLFPLAGLTLLCVACWNSVLNLARMRQGPELMAKRQRLTAAREYFRTELARERPALRDEWFPYLMAFGLGPQMDKWFRAFGGASASASTYAASRSSSSTSSGSSGGGWTGFGGGGGFAGGGSSGSWAAAVGGIAAGVAAPSSSSSGGGGGGGSSGGGGGGGW